MSVGGLPWHSFPVALDNHGLFLYAPPMSASESTTFPVAQSIDVGYDSIEDRLLLVGHTSDHGRRCLWLTRRLVRPLVVHFARLLRTTSEEAGMAPDGYVNEILRMEHVRALESQAEAPPAEAADDSTDTPMDDRASQADSVSSEEQAPHLFFAVEVTLQLREDHLLLGFLGQPSPLPGSSANGDESIRQPVCALLLDRPSAHKVLALFCAKLQEADWGDDVHPDWVRVADSQSPDHIICQ